MSIVDRGSRGERHPRSRWPETGDWRSRSRPPEPPRPSRFGPARATYILAGLCILIHVFGSVANLRIEFSDGTYFGFGTNFADKYNRDRLILDFAFVPSDLATGANRLYLRLVTHMFLHGDWVHLIVNMVVLLSFGRGLEPAMGSGRFVILFFVTGIAAAIGHAVLTDFSESRMIGASGATAGIVGAAVLAAPRLPVLFFIIPMPLYLAVIVLVGVHIAAIAFDWDPGIAWWAHLAGIVAGLALYPLLRRRPAG